jgi:putative pyruvate formate lyase activating enzyme
MKSRYHSLFASGELAERVRILSKQYECCELCPHRCKVNRVQGKKGRCKSGAYPVVASYNAHFGEEPPISGNSGSGTIFFSHCTGNCIFCQNYPISQLGTGTIVSDDHLAEMMLELQSRGCHNINVVTPTHFIPSMVSAICIAAERGLQLPIVYNSSGYERVEILRFLDGIIDVYLPDIKYADDSIALEISGFEHYSINNRSAICEMFRQVGNLRLYHGIAQRGLIVRHLILPGDLAGTADSMMFLSREISHNVRVSLMDQYFPAFNSIHHEILGRRINEQEYNRAIESFYSSGLEKGWIQEHIAD